MMVTQEWQDRWDRGKANAARKAIPFREGDAVWIGESLPHPGVPLTASMLDHILKKKYPAKVVAHHPRRWWREERYTIQFSSGRTVKVPSWRIWKAEG